MTDQASKSPYVGMWVTQDGRGCHELRPNGRYNEARGTRESWSAAFRLAEVES